MKNQLVLAMVMGLKLTTYAQSLRVNIKDVEAEVSGRIGVSISDTQRVIWNYRGDERFPMMSTSKTLVCAKLLSDFDHGRLSERDSSKIERQNLIIWSPVTKKYIGQFISPKQACEAAMLSSDNTAANLVLEKAGGPRAATHFLRTFGDHTTRLDRYEPDLNACKTGDLRDTTTPNAMVTTLRKLLFGEVLTSRSKDQLKQWMIHDKVADSLLRSVLPSGWLIADRSGAGSGSRGITAIIWSERRQPLIIAIYLAETERAIDEQDKIIARIGEAIFDSHNVVPF